MDESPSSNFASEQATLDEQREQTRILEYIERKLEPPIPVAISGKPKVDASIVGLVNIGNFPVAGPISGTVAVSNFPAVQPVSGTVNIGNYPATQPVSVVSLPLPAGAATSALQTTGNTTLAAMAVSLLNLEIYTDGIETLLNSIDTRLTDFKTRSDIFTVAGNGVTVDCSANPLKSFTLQVKGTGAAPTSWTVVLEGSLDNVNFDTILTHTDTGTADGKIIFLGATNCPVLYFRARCSAVVLGGATNIVARILGTK